MGGYGRGGDGGNADMRMCTCVWRYGGANARAGTGAERVRSGA